MLRIISEGNLKLSNCEKCGSILIYDEKEIKQEKNTGRNYVSCENCKNKIILHTVR